MAHVNNAEVDAARLEAVRAYYANDLFAVKVSGLSIVEAQPGRSVVACDVQPFHCNAKGGVMGGVFYTMGDFASSIADWSPDEINYTVDSSMQFLSSVKGTRLIATANAERRGRGVGFYHVEIVDDLGTKVAVGAYTYMHRAQS